MTASTKDIRRIVEQASEEAVNDMPIWCLLQLVSHLNNHIEALETEVKKLKASSKRTADTASCLANGIQPD